MERDRPSRTREAGPTLPDAFLPLSSLLRSTEFFGFDANVMYPCAGSFVRYLIDTYGLAPLKRYFASATFDDTASVTESRVLAAYGRSPSSLWNDWLTWVRSVT